VKAVGPYHFVHLDATGRPDPAAEAAAIQFRAELLEELTACTGYRNARFQLHHIEALAHWLELFEQRPWTRETIRAARRNPVYRVVFGEAWLRSFFGRGRKTRAPWTLMARGIAGLTLDAVRGSDELAGLRRRRGFGSIKGPILKFTHERLQRIAAHSGERVPNIANIRRRLNELLAKQKPDIARSRTRHRARKNARVTTRS
jgi:hypothetical protein